MRTTSLTIEWHNWCLCSGDDMVLERTTVKKASGTIHLMQSNGHREIIHEEFIKVGPDALHELFALVDRILDADDWCADYSVDVCDGFMWNMYIRRGNSKIIRVHGTVDPPPYGAEIERYLRQMLLRAHAIIEPKFFCIDC